MKRLIVILLVIFSVSQSQAQENTKVVLVTGSASGIGKATCELLIENGYIVYGGDINEEGNQYLTALGGTPLYMDVRNDSLVEAGVQRIINEQGRIDVLFANAGYTQMGVIECVEIEDAQNQFDVNVFGVARCVKAVLPHMREKEAGNIIITSSVVGHVPVSGMAWYPASKHALEAFSDALRQEVRRFGIHVSIVEPGFITTGLKDASMPTLDKAKRAEFAKVYEEEQNAFGEKFSKGFDAGASSMTIAKTVLKILKSKYPERRYQPNLDSKAGVFTKRYFGAGLLDDVTQFQFYFKQENPLKRKSIMLSSNSLSFINDGFQVEASYTIGRLRMGANYVDMTFSDNDEIKESRQGIGAYIGTFLSDEQRGLNIGLGFDYYTNTNVTNMNQTLDKDLFRLSSRVGLLWEVIKLRNSGIFIEPAINMGYGFGDEELLFDSGKTFRETKWDFQSSVTIGYKINL